MKKNYVLILFIFLCISCATKKTKYAIAPDLSSSIEQKEISHTFYLIGDAGASPVGDLNPALKIFKEKLATATANSTAIFLGDNIYPAGFTAKKKDAKAHNLAKNHLDAQLKTVDNFKGKTVFIPGNHDWYANGLKGLKREEKYIEKQLGNKKTFFPEDGCPIQKIKINDEVVVIAIDSEWYLTNWDKHPTINDDCDIKSREQFFQELEGLIKKNAHKTTIIAIHHPLFTYGVHGGQYSFKQQFYPAHNKIPLPIIGSLGNLLRKTTGASTTDMQNKRYRELKKRIVTLSQYANMVIIASGHEHSLQYIVEDNVRQIVSGSGAKEGATKLINGSKFSTGKRGYAILEVYKDGSSRVKYYGLNDSEKEAFLYTTEVLPKNQENAETAYSDKFPSYVTSSIYEDDKVQKSKLFKTIWGERYRKYYGTKIQAPTVSLDTLFGGLEPVRKGGGHQSKSLRLVNSEGKEYVMRALKKSAELYLQSMAFKDQYIVGDFEKTYTENLLLDFYTGSHPYAPFTIGVLSDALDIFHTNPVLYYVPKQSALKGFNTDFGDELYMIEERTADGHGNLKSFGYANKLLSTNDLFQKLRKNDKSSIDKTSYLRARLFDMVIGDWDRHADQWRWAEFKEKGKKIYKPIPRDRDQAFSIMGDGPLMGLLTRIVAPLKLMEGFKDEVRNIKGFNTNPFPLDMKLLNETNQEEWLAQVKYIQENLTEDVIDKAFLAFPKEVQDSTVAELKRVLLARVNHLETTANAYFKVLNKYAIIIGTDKDDWFVVKRVNATDTQIKGYRNIDGKKGRLFFNKTYSDEITKELWIYGLDDDDTFEVVGTGKNKIKVRLIGGQNNDVYKVENGRKVVLYDYKTKKNTFENIDNAKTRLTDNYVLNNYRPLHLKSSTNQIIPTIGSNPDDGFKIGFTNVYTFNGFQQSPFTSQHTLNTSYYFATSGYDIGYSGEFSNVVGNAILELDTKFTSPNYSINFFGFGNDTENPDENDLDYNRVKLQTLLFKPSLVWRGKMGSKLRTGISYEAIEVEETEDRFINDIFYVANGAEVKRSFFGVDAEYSYENKDNEAFPTLGMATSLQVGYKTNADASKLNFGYIIPMLSFDYKLVPSGKLVLATKFKAHFNIADEDNFEFYQGASIGGVDGLRGYRNQRFTGKTSYYQNSDIRYNFKKMRTGLLPVSLGIYGGFDYGRVWLSNIDSDTWHTSYGGGFFLNGANVVSANVALFNSLDGVRFTFGLGFGF